MSKHFNLSRGHLGCITLLVQGLLLAWTGDALAYCRSAVCADPKKEGCKVCVPREDDDSGTVKQWTRRCVGYTVQEDASSQVPIDTLIPLVDKAFEAWMNADCGGGRRPSIEFYNLGTVTCDNVEYNSGGPGNTNVITFRDGVWPPHPGRDPLDELSTIALTRTLAFKESKELLTGIVGLGDIVDADMELNSANFRFTTSDNPSEVQYDLLSILTHEVGHFLGLTHSPLLEATMYADYSTGNLAMRDLSQDDIDGICAIYPPDRLVDGECNPLPYHGFSPVCKEEQQQVGCSVARAFGSPGPRTTPHAGFFALGASLFVLARRRATGKAAPPMR